MTGQIDWVKGKRSKGFVESFFLRSRSEKGPGCEEKIM